MSLEQSIAELTGQAALLMDLPDQIADAATGQITRVGDRYDSILASQSVTVYVDQENGDDANNGDEATPLKTIQAALNLTPGGGVCFVRLMNAYHVDADITVRNKHLTIYGHNAIRHEITFERYVSGQYCALCCFKMIGSATIVMHTVRIAIPELGTYSQYLTANTGLFATIGSTYWTPLMVTFSSCEIAIPAAPFTYLFPGTHLIAALFSSCTYPGAISNPLGRVFRDQPNTSGVSASSLPWLMTNLATV